MYDVRGCKFITPWEENGGNIYCCFLNRKLAIHIMNYYADEWRIVSPISEILFEAQTAFSSRDEAILRAEQILKLRGYVFISKEKMCMK